MQMVIAEGVLLVKPLADGRDYAAGELIELDQAVAESWRVRGWVLPVAPQAEPIVDKTEPYRGYPRQSKGRHG